MIPLPDGDDAWLMDDLERYLQRLWDHVRENVQCLLRHAAEIAQAFFMSLSTGFGDWRVAEPSEFPTVSSPQPADSRDLFLRLDDTSCVQLPRTSISALLDHATNRRIFVTSNGYIGLGTRDTQPGDTACILEGGLKPYVLRGQSDHWLMVGECYVHGVMQVRIKSCRPVKRLYLLTLVRVS